LLVLDSEVVIEASDLIADNGGDGGDGAEGQPPQQNASMTAPAAGAGGTQAIGGCQGGAGGAGAAGGSGGGGAGGLSAGIVWSGETEPDVDRATFVLTGTPGNGGLGGMPEATDGVGTPVLAVE
jgi:hypothetical protein